jgi:hypothetical protein
MRSNANIDGIGPGPTAVTIRETDTWFPWFIERMLNLDEVVPLP